MRPIDKRNMICDQLKSKLSCCLLTVYDVRYKTSTNFYGVWQYSYYSVSFSSELTHDSFNRVFENKKLCFDYYKLGSSYVVYIKNYHIKKLLNNCDIEIKNNSQERISIIDNWIKRITRLEKQYEKLNKIK